MAPALSFGQIWSVMFALLRRQWRLIAGFALVFGAIDLLTEFYLQWWYALAVTIISEILGTFALIVTLLRLEGYKLAGLQLGQLLSFFGIFLLSGLAIVIGLVFLIVPGLILMARWSIAYPVALIEGEGTPEAMQASWVNTANSQGAIASFYAIAIIVWVGGAILVVSMTGMEGLTATPASDPILIAADFAFYVVSYLATAFGSASGVAIYNLVCTRVAHLDAVFE